MKSLTADIHRERLDWQLFPWMAALEGIGRRGWHGGQTARLKRAPLVEGDVLIFSSGHFCECRRSLARAAFGRCSC